MKQLNDSLPQSTIEQASKDVRSSRLRKNSFWACDQSTSAESEPRIELPRRKPLKGSGCGFDAH